MKQINKTLLAPAQLEELKAFFHKTKDEREKERCHSILLRHKGYRIKEVAEILERSESAIKAWTKEYLKNGLEGIKSKPQSGNNKKLARQQKEDTKADINHYTPEDLGYNGRFWTVKLLRTHLKEKFGVVYQSERSYHKLFEYCGFTFHRTIKKDKRQDPEKVKKFESDVKKNFMNTPEMMMWCWQPMKRD
jgi:putative transposase